MAADDVQFLPAAPSDALAGEAVVVSTVAVAGDVTTLGLVSPLARIYDATTVNVNANAVGAMYSHECTKFWAAAMPPIRP